MINIGLLLIFLLSACAKTITTPPEAPLPPTTKPPALQLAKTFGDIQTGRDGSYFVEYKNIRMVVDPTSSSPWAIDQVDYVLLTRELSTVSMRKTMKVMAPPSAITALQNQGYSQVKGVSNGQRVYLKKDEAFLFASGVTNGSASGYLFEFDNGRNVFISGKLSNLDGLREFVFSLRDDGREVHAALLMAENDKIAAEAISLLQPQFAFYGDENRRVDRKQMEKMLAEGLYDGTFSVLKRGESIPF